MEKQIDNFIITEDSERVVVDYNKSAKDWFDTLITLALGMFLSVATYFLLQQGFKTTSYIVIAAGFVFAFQAMVQTASGFFRLFQPTKKLLVIDKKTKSLISKHSPFTSKSLRLDNLESLVVSGQNEKVLLGKNRTTRTYCIIKAKLKDNSLVTLFTINANRFIRPSKQKLESELYLKAKQLTTELNNHLKLKYNWTGYNEIDEKK